MRRLVVANGLMVAVMIGLPALAEEQAQPAQAKPAAAAPANPIDGRWEGTIETPEGAGAAVADLKMDGSIIKGNMTAGVYTVAITGGTLAGATVNLTFDVGGMGGTMTATLADGVMTGSWMAEGAGGGFTLKKSAGGTPPPAAAAPASTTPVASGADPLSGDWDAVADAGGQQMPFSLSLKLDGEKVTGAISSDQGGGPIEGTFKDNTVSFSFLTPTGAPISMVATLADGKLTGTLDMAGQFQSGWAASRRK